MNKVIKYIGLTGAAATAACACSDAKKAPKPNIIVIVADDLGWGDLSYHGSVIPTPNIDRIAREGIEMNRFYVAPVSSPTRCGIMTGRYPSRFGIRETVIPPWRDYGLDENERTMADVLGENGYANRAMIGKWHLGHSRLRYYPLNRGFTHFYGCLNGALDYFTHLRENELDWHNDWDSCWDEGYTTDLIAAEAARCIEEYTPGDPYFLYVCFNAPHAPNEAPEDEIAKHIPLEEFAQLKKKDQKGYTYRAMVTRMDTGVGQIMDALEKSGERNNTIVLFMSDNGSDPQQAPYGNSGELRGTKFEEWEGGVRADAAIWWPDGFQNGRKIEQVTGFVDLLPTFADIIGVRKKPARPYDGISIYPVLKGKKDHIERDMYLGVGAGVNSQYKMILAGKSERLGLKEDFITDIIANPGEKNKLAGSDDQKAIDHLRKVIEEGDAIVPVHPEIPYGQGQKGFVAPKEWKLTEY